MLPRMNARAKTRLAAAAFAAVSAAAPGAPAAGGAGDWARTDVSQARLVSAASAVGDGELRAGLHFQLDPGWKIYWRSPGDSGSPPVPDFAASQNVAAVEVAWPAPRRFAELAGLETAGYTDETVLPLRVAAARADEAVRLRARVPYQACETVCIPFVAELALDLPPGAADPTPWARLIDRYEARVPGPPEAAGVTVESFGIVGAPPDERLEIALRSALPFEAPELFVEAGARYRVAAGTAEVSRDGASARLVAPVEARGGVSLAGEPIVATVVDGDRAFELATAPGRLATGSASFVADAADAESAPSFAAVLAVALLGGLILNLMPCVLPVLSLKLMGVVGQGGRARAAVRRDFAASAAGVVASFLALAAAAAVASAFGAAAGWGIQFQQPAFLVFLALVVSLFAGNLLGVFDIAAPARLLAAGAAAPDRAEARFGAPAGHFASGAFATLLATPCSAPFVGTAVAFALSRGAGEIFAVFAALGLGMAAPWIAVAAFPGVATRLPRPGRWMTWVRAALGLALVGTAAWLLSVLAALSGVGAALVAGAACLAGAPAVRLALARGRRRAFGLGLSAAAMLAAAFVGATPPLSGSGEAEAAGETGFWRPFDAAAIDAAVAEGRTVFVDVTADWCVTCRVNKALVLDAEPVRGRLAAPSVLAMRADWTRPDPAISAYLARFDRYGIPFNAVYGPAARGGVTLPELLRADAVIAALDRTRRGGFRLGGRGGRAMLRRCHRAGASRRPRFRGEGT